MKTDIGKLIYEFIGTFFLMLTIGMTVLNPNSAGLFAPLAIGSVLAAMVYAGAHVSGGHYNPAVSLALFFRKKLNVEGLIGYIVAQLLGAAAAAFAVMYLKNDAIATPVQIDPLKAFLAEFLFTFALCYVVINVATGRKNSGNAFYGFAIGFIVLAGAYAVGAISGAAFNPAVAFGASLLKLSAWHNIWVYLLAAVLAAGAASAVCRDCE